MRAAIIGSLALTLVIGATGAFAETRSDYNKEYDLAAIKAFDFKPQTRISRDPIANNSIWGTQIREAIAANLKSHGLREDGTETPDVLVAFYVGLRERYDMRYLGYGVPFYGRSFRSRWGWPSGYDAWAVPYTESTLIVDLVDARTNQLVWRGYNQDSINLGKTEKDFTKAVNDVLKKFYGDIRKTERTNPR
jgi:hypothetical protein